MPPPAARLVGAVPKGVTTRPVRAGHPLVPSLPAVSYTLPTISGFIGIGLAGGQVPWLSVPSRTGRSVRRRDAPPRRRPACPPATSPRRRPRPHPFLPFSPPSPHPTPPLP